MRSIVDKLLLVTLIAMWVFVAWLILWPFEPIRVDAIQIDKKIVKRGGEICFDLVGEKLLSAPAETQIDITNSINVPLFNYKSNASVGKLKSRPYCSFVPNRTEYGENRIRYRFTHYILGIRPVVTEAYSEPFEVTK